MTDEARATRTLRLADMIALAALGLSLGGLIWQASAQSTKIDMISSKQIEDEKRQGTDEAAAAKDHDSLTAINSSLAFLVDRAKQQDGSK
ncbi:MAG: hypothetical protein JO290_06395 [Sphingomonadaceae bacterium]|nr:hypothetical protein [Sphingomonadaceae bacterium]